MVDCVLVDGATDEGPTHDEVQIWWMSRYLMLGRKSCYTYDYWQQYFSYRNHIELQNGCLSLGHPSTSTLEGSCDSDTGKIDEEKLSNNMELAIDASINRVNGAPCEAQLFSCSKE